MLDAKIIESMLEGDIPVSLFDSLESTNLTARQIALSDERRERLIIARSQTGGRGRLGRSFFSPSGGLYMSLLLFPDCAPSGALRITTAASVATARAIDRVAGTKCEIKWVNDVYLSGRKACGILTESQIAQDGTIDFAVLGIGINLTAPTGGFPEDIADRAGAVFDTLPDGAENKLAAQIVNEFYRIWQANDNSLIFEYRERSNLIGREVDVIRFVGDEPRAAKVIEIGDDFSLVVEYEDGEREALSSGDVSVRKK